MALIDTNILIYATQTDCPQYAEARAFLKNISEGEASWNLTWQNVFEFVRTATDARTVQGQPLYIDEALGVIRRFLESPSLQIIHPGSRHLDIFCDLASHTPGIRGGFVHDARLVAIMLENSVRQIYTADDGFRRFRDIEVVNPFR